MDGLASIIGLSTAAMLGVDRRQPRARPRGRDGDYFWAASLGGIPDLTISRRPASFSAIPAAW